MASIYAEERERLYTTYDVELQLHHWLMAGNPKDPKLIEGWLGKQAGIIDDPETTRRMTVQHLRDMGVVLPEDATPEDIDAALDHIAEEKHTCGFKSHYQGQFVGPYIEARQVKAMMREAVNDRFPYGTGQGQARWGATKKSPFKYFVEQVEVVTPVIGWGRNEPDGVEPFYGHPEDKGRTISTLTYYEYADRPTLAYQVQVYNDAEEWINEAAWKKINMRCEDGGIGALRSQGFGRFDVTKFEPVKRLSAARRDGRESSRRVPVPA